MDPRAVVIFHAGISTRDFRRHCGSQRQVDRQILRVRMKWWLELGYGGAGSALAFAAWCVRGRSSSVLAPSVWRGPRDRKAIALTFDDGPSESTPELCEVLEKNSARATFFQIGKHVERLPAVTKRVVEGGHE